MWTHDFAPVFDTTHVVERCIVVGVPKEATPSTLKVALREPVSFVDPPTSTAGLGCVGIDLNERHPSGSGLIGQEAA